MKKRAFFMVWVLSFAVILGGCGSAAGSTSTAPPKSQKPDLSKMMAADIVAAMKQKITTINNVIIYDEKTDENNLLGRPGQYISKANFADTRAKQYDPKDPRGGTIETFKTDEDAKARYEYVKPLVSKAPFLQYVYLYKNILMRIEGELTPEQAKEYEDIFNTMK